MKIALGGMYLGFSWAAGGQLAHHKDYCADGFGLAAKDLLGSGW